MIKTLRTTYDRFKHLPGYDFAPHYVDSLSGYEGLREHYLDGGDPTSGEVFLCLHGEPSSSYLYRKMIPVFAAAGVRVIAPDWLALGVRTSP
ncbi:MAG: alpha/beta fold hydrolase [Pseudomonadota bacterium]